MNVRTLCLSILFDCDATGYEIRRRCVEGECSYFVEASFGSIYPALARLEDDGLVTSRTEPQDGKPARKVYSITEAGRDAFTTELSQPLGEDVFRSPFLLFARLPMCCRPTWWRRGSPNSCRGRWPSDRQLKVPRPKLVPAAAIPGS